MFRIIIILAAILLVFLIIKNRLNSRSVPAKKNGSTTTDEMVKCLLCKTYIPRKEAIISGTDVFCCKQHQRDWENDHQR